MSVDWDKNVFGPVAGVFGETVNYIPASGLPFDMPDATFEEQYIDVRMLDDTSALTTEQPALTVRLIYFPGSSKPRQNDRVTIPSVKATYIVRDVHLDNHGQAKLLLQLQGPTP